MNFSNDQFSRSISRILEIYVTNGSFLYFFLLLSSCYIENRLSKEMDYY